MKEITCEEIIAAVKEICITANYDLGEDVEQAFQHFLQREASPTGKKIFLQLLENASIAREESVPMCQDTGAAVTFIELGQGVRITGGYLEDAINEGVKQGYTEGYLRKSMVKHPWNRENTGDNTPAIIHTRIVPGDTLKITVAPKGGGSENMSAVKMMVPADGLEGIKKFVIDQIVEAGPNPCPPIIVGVGVGGNFEKCALLAKETLLRPIGSSNPDPELQALEEELLDSANKLGIGPLGLGGTTTALAIHIKVHPCHIASMPVAVNINCHASRHKSVIL
ncbi:MAG: fumarate hydratase [Clostridia bacterium]|jgi:fumarate hydratase subunit alpha|nr:fumarate hydratase [Clostridia bacterium]